MLFTFAMRAFADDAVSGAPMEAADVACSPLMVTHSIPAANQENVAVDVNPTLILEGNCGGAHAWTFEIVDVAGAILYSEPWTWDDTFPVIATVTPDVDLPANADLVLRAVPSDEGGEFGQLVEIPFSTGESHLLPLVGAPAIDITSAIWFKNSRSVEVIADIIPAEDPNGLSLLRIVSPGFPQFVPAALLVDQHFNWSEADPPDEVCLTVVQIDGSGVASEPVEACEDPINRRSDGTGGCFSREERAPTRGLFVLGAILLFARRRS